MENRLLYFSDIGGSNLGKNRLLGAPAGPCQATNGMRGGIERGPCRASGVGVKVVTVVVSKNRLLAKRDLKFQTFARQDVLPIHMPHRRFLEDGRI